MASHPEFTDPAHTGRLTASRAGSSIRSPFGFLFLALFALGCASTPIGPPFRDPEPPPEHRARLVLYRTDRQGSLASVKIAIDGREIGRFRNREYETILLTPGTHLLRAGLRGFGLFAWGWNSHRFVVNAGETTYLEISVRLDARDAPNAPNTRELEIAGRADGAASENVFIVPKSAQDALDDLRETTRIHSDESRTKTE